MFLPNEPAASGFLTSIFELMGRAVRRIAKIGRRQWKKGVGYHDKAFEKTPGYISKPDAPNEGVTDSPS